MVGKELVLQRDGPVDVREIAAKATLREVRQNGHTYVELRRVGKRVIFFCTICLTECFSDNVLFDHLKGNLHSRRYAEAKVTLFGPMPWPFNDGVFFFNNSRENDPLLLDSSSHNTKELALVPHAAFSGNDTEVTSRLRDGPTSHKGVKGAFVGANGHANGRTVAVSENLALSNHNGTDDQLVIPGVLVKDVVLNLPVHLLGYGNIAYRISEASKGCNRISKIWCAWVGQEASQGSEGCNIYEQSGFAIVNFPYTYELGRKWPSDDQDLRISAGSFFVIDDAGHRGKRRKKSFSDQEASSEESNGHGSSGRGKSEAIVTGSLTGTSCNQVSTLSSKSMRRELRKQNRLAAEKVCDICGRAMLPGKDVATLLNCSTGNLACSSRNLSGAFHLFHTSCLLHWTILCQYEVLADQMAKKRKSNRGRKAKTAPKSRIVSILCPECQGTGIHVDGDELEKPTISLSEMFRYKLKAIEAHKAWMKNPEVLGNCSTGLHFPSEHLENSEEQVMPLKSLAFYAADG